ncbi:MAG: hypothetical protein H6741_26490 [Alphaproteobacteria bacterium]|nr:hypothetical protein [Alphaproteobacteria bacterium]MCB9796258.1 hypothetical protein [Alphaproteobacteria bacterium]
MFIGLISPQHVLELLLQHAVPLVAFDLVAIILGALLLARAVVDLRALGATLRALRASPPAPPQLLAMSKGRLQGASATLF